MPEGEILSARRGDSKCQLGGFYMLEALRIPPTGTLVPLEVSTEFRYLQLTNQITRITSAIV